MATLLVQSGTLRRGDVLLAGTFGRVRAMLDENGKPIEEAGSVDPGRDPRSVRCAGCRRRGGGPGRRAQGREIALFRQGKFRDVKLAKQQAAKPREHVRADGRGERKTLPLIIKADVQGSQEALATRWSSCPPTKSGAGHPRRRSARSANPTSTWPGFRAVIIGFNIRADANARKLAETFGVDLRYYNIIYDAVDEVKSALSGMLAPEKREQILGWSRSVRSSPSKGRHHRGCYVLEGLVKRGSRWSVLRNHVVIHSGEPGSRSSVSRTTSRKSRFGYECGLQVEEISTISRKATSWKCSKSRKSPDPCAMPKEFLARAAEQISRTGLSCFARVKDPRVGFITLTDVEDHARLRPRER